MGVGRFSVTLILRKEGRHLFCYVCYLNSVRSTLVGFCVWESTQSVNISFQYTYVLRYTDGHRQDEVESG